ncbi:MAG TPA: FMN-binding protein, partial [Pseudomonadales bacterium]
MDEHELMDLVSRMFPTADDVGRFDGTPPSASVRQGIHTLGYVFYTSDVSPIPAYSGKPINALVGLDMQGNILGVHIVHHEEPILVVGLSSRDLEKFTDQYKHIPASADIRINGRSEPDQVVLDGISGATITTMVLNRTISKSAKMVAAARGLISKDAAATSLNRVDQQPLWKTIWLNERINIVILCIALVVLFVILLIQDWLARHPRLLLRVRTGYLIFT